MTKLKVAVRVRPLSKREKDVGAVSVISVENGDSLEITNIKVPEQNAGDSRERVRRFTFDYCFQESCKQDQVFESVEKVISQSVKQRFHSCVLAYGQSSTGKTHTMMGVPDDPGLTPKLCERVFGYLQETAVGEEFLNMRVSVSYLEIYNEKVRDLLAPEEYPIKTARKHSSLKVREHPKRGPYVQGLSEHPVTCSSDLLDWLEKGNKKRKVAATLSNPQSSRSHSVFSVNCDGVKLNLIDLAGSERAANRCFDISRFKEGTNINKSLVALGNVISALAEQTSKQAKGIRRRFVPYRDSVLTWLLKDILGGNSNTVMVATVSPSSACYSETVNTLRFGQRAKNIISRPVVNEDPKEKTIRELRAEIFRLKEILSVLQISPQIQMNSNTKVTTTKFHKNPNIETSADLTELTEEVEDLEAELFTDHTEELKITGNLTDENKSSIKLSNTSELNSIEKLLPLINVSSSLKTNKPTTLKRTFSVDRTLFKMERDNLNSPGLDDSFKSSTKSLISTMSSERDSLNSRAGTSHGSSRRGSLSKPAPLLPKTTPKRRSLEIPSKKKIEKGYTTEPALKKIESKVGSIRQRPLKPRAQIVAAVTSRLYSKLKTKEVSTDTDDINTYHLEEVTPKELSICENARTRLREISRKALRAHRNKNEETQTEVIQMRRVKETSTDVSDLKLELTEVKEAGTMFDVIQTKDVSIDCMPLESFDETDNRKSVSFTRSCGTQSIGEGEEEGQESKASTKVATPMSFTKYLRDVQEDLPPNPIYTKTVNINISNNYLNGERVANSHSEDSLEHPGQNVCLATPDLLSNHNSLEHHQGSLREVEQELSHESIGDIGYQFFRSEPFDPPKSFKTFNVAECGTVPKFANLSPSVLMSKTYAPEVYMSRMYQEEFCVPFPKFKPPTGMPRLVESETIKCDEVVVVKEPLVLKSIVKNQSSTSEDTESFNPRDSLEYHRANKKVQFSEKGADDSQRMIKAMASFLEEATQLIAKIDRSRTPPLDYDVEVTVNGVTGVERSARKTRKKSSSDGTKNKSRRVLGNQREELHNHEKCVQTLSPIRTHSSTQYDLPYSLPVNKYETILESSCKRLEEKIRRVPQSRVVHHAFRGDTQEIHRNFYLEEPNISDVDDSSLDSHPVASSDYGSLPRKRYARRAGTCSPSAFLRQLTQMRQQIVKSSREDSTGSGGN